MAEKLSAAGYSLWWDRHIAGGAEFSEEIEKELAAAKAVIVAWSDNGSKSRWVKDEAGIAARDGKLIAISLDGTEPPIGFKQFHAIDFSAGANDAFAEITRSVALKLDPNTAPKPEMPAPVLPSGGRKKLAMAAVATIAALLASYLAISSMQNTPAPEQNPATETAANNAQKPEGDYRSIAVLAFADLSPNSDQEYFSDGIAEELSNVLARETSLRVAARTSSFAFKGKEQNIAEIGKALNVDAVLEGSVRKAGEKLRITAQLIDAQSGFHLWTQTYDRELTDIFAIQDEIAWAIVGSLPRSDAPQPVAAVQQANREAYDLYLQGRHHLKRRTQPSIEQAKSLFERALTIDPDYAPSWAGLAMSALLLRSGPGTYGDLSLDEIEAIVEPAIEKALALDPGLAETYTVKGLLLGHQGNFSAASESYRQAIALNQSTPNARHLLYLSLLGGGEFREAFAVIDEAAAFDPLSGIILENHVASLINRGRAQDALKVARRLLDLHPDWPLAKFAVANAYNANGQFAEAIQLIEEATAAARSLNINAGAAFQLLNIRDFDHPLVRNAPVDPASFLAVNEGRHGDARDMVMALYAREPDNPRIVWRTGWTLWAIGDDSDALDIFEKYMQQPGGDAAIVTPSSCYPGLYIAGLYRQFDNLAAAQPIIDRCRAVLENMSEQGYVIPNFERDMPVELMMVEGRHDEALDALRALADTGEFISWWIDIEPNYRPLYDDPRFQAIVADLRARADSERDRFEAGQ